MRFDPEASKAETPKAPPARCIGCAKSEYVVFCHSIPGGSQAAQTKACSQRRLSGVARGANAPVDKQESASPQRKHSTAQHSTAQCHSRCRHIRLAGDTELTSAAQMLIGILSEREGCAAKKPLRRAEGRSASLNTNHVSDKHQQQRKHK
ncbi:hypothetical protein GGF40_001015 [Coemansia sp. RSA 1286]|nr:hypothetical protein GGF40_001015 [Coemansia sp. RSA 1286]